MTLRAAFPETSRCPKTATSCSSHRSSTWGTWPGQSTCWLMDSACDVSLVPHGQRPAGSLTVRPQDEYRNETHQAKEGDQRRSNGRACVQPFCPRLGQQMHSPRAGAAERVGGLSVQRPERMQRQCPSWWGRFGMLSVISSTRASCNFQQVYKGQYFERSVCLLKLRTVSFCKVRQPFNPASFIYRCCGQHPCQHVGCPSACQGLMAKPTLPSAGRALTVYCLERLQQWHLMLKR